jgi:hypothetical protein
MADSKITALTALTAADPANDMIPIVDVSDTPPASGNTKRISINNILACSPSATLASATITGDLTVDTNVLKVDTTNNVVGIGTTTPNSYAFNDPAKLVIANDGTAGAGNTFSIVSGSTGFGNIAFANGTSGTARFNGYIAYNHSSNFMAFYTNAGAERYRLGSDGTATWSVGGSTAMTLNSTGLGVGVTPLERLTIAGSGSFGGTGNIGVKFHSAAPASNNLSWLLSNDSANSNVLNLYYYSAGVFSGRAFVVNQSGNFIVRTPATPPTIPDNEMMVFNLTSNTNLRISVKGTDGTTRTANITLA